MLPSDKKDSPASPKQITRSVSRSLERFQAIGIAGFKPHDLRRTGRTELARLGVSPHVAERLLNHTKDALIGTYDLYEYLDEKRAALERWEGTSQAAPAGTRIQTLLHRCGRQGRCSGSVERSCDTGDLSEFSCSRHIMTYRSRYAEKEEARCVD